MSKGLDEILSGEQPEQVVEQPSAEPVAEPSTPEPQPRAPDGKFASKEPSEPEPAPSEATAEKEQQPHRAPPGVIEERNKRKSAEERAADLERQLAELSGKLQGFMAQPRTQPAPQPAPEPPKPVDFWEDPNKFIEQALAPLQAERMQERFEQSVERNISKHGEEAVEAAETALRAAIEAGQLNGETVKAQLGQSRDPIGDIVRWHQNQPASIEARLRAEIEAKVRAEIGQAPAPQMEQPSIPQNMPSNLVGQRNVGTRSGPAWSGPASINDIFDRSRAKKAG
jgi:hypothetical protein